MLGANLRKLILRTIASRYLSVYLSLLGSLFVNKELTFNLLDEALTIILFPRSENQVQQLLHFIPLLLYYVIFFFLAYLIVRITHVDDLIRDLTLKAIRYPESYFIYVHKFILDRFHSDATFASPSRFFDEINSLLEIGQKRFGLPHKRSVSFLLGIDYIRVKKELFGLDSAFANIQEFGGNRAQIKSQIKNKIGQTRGNLASYLTDPIACLDDSRGKTSVIDNSYLENLEFLLKLAAEPSYETALIDFCRELRNIIAQLSGQAARGSGKKRIIAIRDDAVEILKMFKERGRARIGFPLFNFIDIKQGNSLTNGIKKLNSLNINVDDLRSCLSNISGTLTQFENMVKKSSTAFTERIRAVSTVSRQDVFDPQKDLICLYGFSKTVVNFIEGTIKDVNQRKWMEIILIKTDGKATTSSEENKIRDELLERGFSNLVIYSFQDLLAIQGFEKSVKFLLGFEVINPIEKKAIFHFGAGQILQTLIRRLVFYGNTVHVYLIGAKYKEIPFTLENPEIEHSSVFDLNQINCNYIWVNEEK